MKWRAWLIMTAALLAGLGVVVGAWGSFTVGPEQGITPGGFEVWQTLRPGEQWQSFWGFRDGVRFYGGALFLLCAALALLHYALIGPDQVPASGRMVERFQRRERLTHWMAALSFLVLLASGLYLLWNRLLVGGPAPVWGRMGSAAHIWAGLVFLMALLAMWIQWRRDMRFVSYDRQWLRRAGGYLSREHPRPMAGRFNAGQKVWFRVALLLGMLLGVSGLLLYYPGGVGLSPTVQWVLFVVHTAGAAALVPSVLMHVYMGAVANPGTLTGMATGRIEENLVRAHHPDSRPAREAASPA